MDATGNFVIAWTSREEGVQLGVYARRFNAAGVAQGTDFRANSYTVSDQQRPSVAMDTAGTFVIAWESVQDGGGFGVYAQRYNAAGVKQAAEFRVNSHTAGAQSLASVAADDDGDFVIAWSGQGQDDSSGIFAQRFAVAPEVLASAVALRVGTAPAPLSI